MTDTPERFFKVHCEVADVDESLGVVFGHAMVCKTDGADYWDLQEDQIPEATMIEAGLDFMKNSRVAQDNHSGVEDGGFPFCFPMSSDIAKALGVETQKTGLLVGYKPDTEGMLEKFRTGEYTGFSIGGIVIESEIVEDG